jgi:hypothetical protein
MLSSGTAVNRNQNTLIHDYSPVIPARCAGPFQFYASFEVEWVTQRAG